LLKQEKLLCISGIDLKPGVRFIVKGSSAFLPGIDLEGVSFSSSKNSV